MHRRTPSPGGLHAATRSLLLGYFTWARIVLETPPSVSLVPLIDPSPPGTSVLCLLRYSPVVVPAILSQVPCYTQQPLILEFPRGIL